MSNRAIIEKELTQGVVPIGTPKAYQYDQAIVESAKAAVEQGVASIPSVINEKVQPFVSAAAESASDADATATALTTFLETKETLTAPAVDPTLTISSAAADAKVVGNTFHQEFPTTNLEIFGTITNLNSDATITKAGGKYILNIPAYSNYGYNNYNFGISVPVGVLLKNAYLAIKVRLIWNGNEEIEDANLSANTLYVFLRDSFFYSPPWEKISNHQFFNLKYYTDSFNSSSAKLHIAGRVRPNEFPTHITQNEDTTWSIDQLTVEITCTIFNDEYKKRIVDDQFDLSGIVPLGYFDLSRNANPFVVPSITFDGLKTKLNVDALDAQSLPDHLYFAIHNILLNKKYFQYHSAKIVWSDNTEKILNGNNFKIFVNNSFTWTGYALFSADTEYELDSVFANYTANAQLYLDVVFSTTFDSDHVYQQNGIWHIDAFTLVIDGYVFNPNSATYLMYANKDNPLHNEGITCWGDSLTQMGGWTDKLEELSGMTVHNCGMGGEGINQITARQGANAYIVDSITIPATTTNVTLGTFSSGINTQLGSAAKPFITAAYTFFNPCYLGDVEGTLLWTGATRQDTTGLFVFKRNEAGTAVTIDRPVAIRTKGDMLWNSPYLMTILMGQNDFGFNNENNITTTISEANIKNNIRFTRLMMSHAHAENVIVLGLATGTAASNADYEAAMKEEFGRYFISLREYLVHPIYNSNNEVINCYGLQDLGLTASAQDLVDISNGKVPAACFMDGVHFVEELRPHIGEYIYKCCKELTIFDD